MTEKSTQATAIEWAGRKPNGRIDVRGGEVRDLRIARGQGSASAGGFAITSDGPCRIEFAVGSAMTSEGANSTIVHVRTAAREFSFFLRDVRREHPIIVPAYGVAVTARDDPRSYDDILESVRRRGLLTDIQQIEKEPEETFANAAAQTRNQTVPTLLGIGRDDRVFLVGYGGDNEVSDWIEPWFHNRRLKLDELGEGPVRYGYQFGRGVGCIDGIHRRLEEGVLPILRTRIDDGDVEYELTTFVTLGSQPLDAKRVSGSHFLLGAGALFTEDLKAKREQLIEEENQREEQTILCIRAEAVNTANVPRYAFSKGVNHPTGKHFDGKTGYSSLPSGKVYCIAKLNGEPMPQEEMAVLLMPGQRAVFEFFVPHSPIPAERAHPFSRLDFEEHLEACRSFWREKISSAARIELPEQGIQERLYAGLLHLDLHTYGLEPDGTLAPEIGLHYCPIGTESAPIIQFMDSMGRHDIAERSLQFFLDLQREDGFMQNFGDYMVETGAALWSMGEHYRYTRDEKWVRRIVPKLLKSCDFLLAWRERNKREELRGQGYGLIDGKVGDPEDPYHSFMLNGYAYLGLKRVAEMLERIDPERSAELTREAETWKKDIRTAFFEAMARSPVVPLGDGTWCPTAPPWAERNYGPLALHSEDENCWTHGSHVVRDSLVGPLYLIFQEVLDPTEPAAAFLLNSQKELFMLRNVAYSQPYYSRHAFVHLKRGEVRAFLKTYYNTMASLADRETYTFWEHHFHAAPHKTHEEGWFLMQTRWMLYMEEGRKLRLLPGIPREWLEDGKHIRLDDAASCFGPFSLHVESRLQHGEIKAEVKCRTDRAPDSVELRLPHPEQLKAKKVSGGEYDANAETVRIDPFKGEAAVTLTF